MAITKDNSGDDLARGLAAALNLAGAAGDMLELWRAMTDALASVRERHTEAEGDSGTGEVPPSDPVALLVRINAVLWDGGMRYWLRWQELMSGHVPNIRRSLEELRAGEQPTDEARAALLREVREYVRVMTALPCDLCRELQQELRALEDEVFADEERLDRRIHRYKS